MKGRHDVELRFVAAQTTHHQNDGRWDVDNITERVEIAVIKLYIAWCDGAHATESSLLEFTNSFVVRSSCFSKDAKWRVCLLVLTNLSLAFYDLV